MRPHSRTITKRPNTTWLLSTLRKMKKVMNLFKNTKKSSNDFIIIVIAFDHYSVSLTSKSIELSPLSCFVNSFLDKSNRLYFPGANHLYSFEQGLKLLGEGRKFNIHDDSGEEVNLVVNYVWIILNCEVLECKLTSRALH